MPVPRETNKPVTGIDSAWKMLNTYNCFPVKSIRHMRLPSSIEVLFSEISPDKAINNTITTNRAPLEFGFHLSGTGRAHVSHLSSGNEVVEGKPGKVFVSYIPGATCRTELSAGQQYRVLNVYVSPEKLYTVLGSNLDQVPRCLHALLRGEKQSPFIFTSSISRQTRMIIEQMEKSPYRGSPAGLLMEAKSMELIARQLSEGMENTFSARQRTLCPDDIEKIYRARQILFREIDDPPALPELSTRVGTNPTKLKKGFRQVFGTTAYALVRKERVERAKIMLSRGNTNITQIAQTLGFCDASHFIREFSRYYGTTPGKFPESYPRKQAGPGQPN